MRKFVEKAREKWEVYRKFLMDMIWPTFLHCKFRNSLVRDNANINNMGASDYIPVSQVEQGDAADAPPPQPLPTQSVGAAVLEETLTELNVQIRRSSIWVYYMLLVQVVCIAVLPTILYDFNNYFLHRLFHSGTPAYSCSSSTCSSAFWVSLEYKIREGHLFAFTLVTQLDFTVSRGLLYFTL
jgi:hypothetical protein